MDFSERPRFRSESMENIRIPKYDQDFLLVKKELSLYEKINKYLRRFKEIRILSKYTKIPPFYFLLVLSLFIGYILLRLFINNLSLSLATIYPLFMTFKSLQNYDANDSEGRKEVVHWLKYWIFYSCFLNFESWFGHFLKQFYTFCKLFFLMNCFPRNSNILDWIYSIIFNFFCKYENMIESFSKKVKKNLLEESSGDSNNEENDSGNFGEFIGDKIQGGKMALRFITKKLV